VTGSDTRSGPRPALTPLGYGSSATSIAERWLSPRLPQRAIEPSMSVKRCEGDNRGTDHLQVLRSGATAHGEPPPR